MDLSCLSFAIKLDSITGCRSENRTAPDKPGRNSRDFSATSKGFLLKFATFRHGHNWLAGASGLIWFDPVGSAGARPHFQKNKKITRIWSDLVEFSPNLCAPLCAFDVRRFFILHSYILHSVSDSTLSAPVMYFPWGKFVIFLKIWLPS
jgi:hypothetical protein